MSLTTNEPMPKTGVDRLHYFKLEEDTSRSLTYGEGIEVEGLVKIGFSVQSRVETFYADNVPYTTNVSTGELMASVEGADFTPAVLSDWQGNSYENGLFTFLTAETRYFGLAWRIQKSNGAYRYVRLYKGLFSIPNQDGQTATNGTIHYQTANITFSGVVTRHNKQAFAILDDDDPHLPAGVTKEMIEENWFRDPAWVPEAVNAAEMAGIPEEAPELAEEI